MKDYLNQYNQRDYTSLTVNVMKPDVIPSQHQFFAKKSSFQNKIEGVNTDTFIRYIVLFYDPKSPLLDRIPDHIERKKAAAQLAGFKAKDGKFPKAVETVLYCKNREANDCIVEFLRALRNPDYAFIASAWEGYYKILTEIMSDAKTGSGKGSNKTSVDIAASRAKLSQEASNMATDLNDRTLRFFSQDSSPYLSEHLFDLIETEKRGAVITQERYIGFEN